MSTVAVPFRLGRRTRRSSLRSIAAAWSAMDARPWNVGMLLLLTVLIITYLAFTNGNATSGYELRTLERQTDALREETRRLELQSLSTQSIESLTARLVDQGYVPVAHVRYLDPARPSVAAR